MFPLTKIGKKCHKVCHEFTIISVFHATAFVGTKINFIAVFFYLHHENTNLGLKYFLFVFHFFQNLNNLRKLVSLYSQNKTHQISLFKYLSQ